MSSATASSSHTAGQVTTDEASNIQMVQAFEIKALAAMMQEMGESRANVQVQLASLASKPCHCADVDKLMADMVSAGGASAQAFKRIQDMEVVLTKLTSEGAPMRSPPGVPFTPGASSFFGAAPGGQASGAQDQGRGEPYTSKFINQKTYRQIADLDKLFDDKAATSSSHACNGDANEGVKWHKTVRGYFISRNKVLSPILDFVEKHELKEVTLAKMEEECNIQGWMIEDLERLSEVLWGFLNTCLKGPAKESFDAAEDLDGFNAWRIVVQDIRKGRDIRLGQTRRAVRNPPPANGVAHIA